MKAHIVMPFLDCWELTRRALLDCLAQAGADPVVLAIDNGSGEAARAEVDRLHESLPTYVQNPRAVLKVWHHDPPMPSLSATWNRALEWAWESGAEECLVVNNDVRLHPETYKKLLVCLKQADALLVSAVGVTEEQFDVAAGLAIDLTGALLPAYRGGPDFSCFLLSKELHRVLGCRFDENFIPAFCEDLDYHRRMMLQGLGSRIFSVNVPYLHYASQTLKTMNPERRQKMEEGIARGSRAYYERKWGGGVNQERFLSPFGKGNEHEVPPGGSLQRYSAPGGAPLPLFERCLAGCVTTPELQAHGCGGRA